MFTSELHKPTVFGVLNVTPDSFSDGGHYVRLESAVDRAEEMEQEGADYVDIGGESTRPGAQPVSLEEEWNRVIPIIQAIRKRSSMGISVDTRKFEIARAAVEAGADVINDISGGSDVRMAELAKSSGCAIILMHMQGQPQTMQEAPHYPRGVVPTVREFFEERLQRFLEIGVERENIWLDPGIGFGKTVEDNLALLRSLSSLNLTGNLMVGTSRKSFLGRILGEPDLPFSLRQEGTLATNLYAWMQGANLFRVHEPGSLIRLFRTWKAVAS